MESNREWRKVGCDIGGVIRDMRTEEPIENAVDCVKRIAFNCPFVFISKCKKDFQEKTNVFLKQIGLDSFTIIYCESGKDKVNLARQANVTIMIDDKIQVLRCFPDTTQKIWFCNDEKRISGLKKYEPELFAKLIVMRDWMQLEDYLRSQNDEDE
eukprot:TRINITY_DN1283_c0_g1_i1.p1 TRINITY_DN1283_c0_g1~~TRINITY_DN1283_c0_g1_i1.p1  ORF type:complete len:155 (-),score=29.89 TRINITY_DN1283_c0_g1_i1:80-544(-)